MRNRASSIATYVRPLSTKHRAIPAPAMRNPAAAGPSARATLMRMVLSVTALRTCSGPVISSTKLCRAGLSKARTHPNTSAKSHHHPQLHRPGRDQRAQGHRERAGERLGHGEQAPLVPAVGDHAGPRADQHGRQELQRDGHAQQRARAGQLQDQPRLRDLLHPVAGERDRLRGEVEAVVARAQGRERLAGRDPHARHSATSRSRTGQGGQQRRELVVVQHREPLTEVGGRGGATALEQRDPRPA